MNAKLHARICALLQQGNKIMAVKVYREATGLGLKEALDAVNEIEAGAPVMTEPPPEASDEPVLLTPLNPVMQKSGAPTIRPLGCLLILSLLLAGLLLVLFLKAESGVMASRYLHALQIALLFLLTLSLGMRAAEPQWRWQSWVVMLSAVGMLLALLSQALAG